MCQFSLLNKNLICNPQKQSKIRSRTFNKTIFEGTEHFSVVWFILHNPAEWGRHAINYYRKISISTLDFQATSGAFSLLVSFSLTLSRDNDPDIWKELRQHWPMEQIFLIFLNRREAREMGVYSIGGRKHRFVFRKSRKDDILPNLGGLGEILPLDTDISNDPETFTRPLGLG